MRSRRFVGLLALAALVGVVASLGRVGVLELIHQIQVIVFYDDAPTWWPVPVSRVAGLLLALAIVRLPAREVTSRPGA